MASHETLSLSLIDTSRPARPDLTLPAFAGAKMLRQANACDEDLVPPFGPCPDGCDRRHDLHGCGDAVAADRRHVREAPDGNDASGGGDAGPVRGPGRLPCSGRAALAGLRLGERVGPRRLAAVVVGLIGALIVIRPGAEFSVSALLPLVAATGYALNMIVLRQAARTR